MYAPKYYISNAILNNIGQVEAAREVIDNAPIVPQYEKQFQSEAIIRTIYHGTHIEGNDLTFDQTKQVLEGQQVFAHERDIQEVINYRNVMIILDDLVNKRVGYNLDDLLEIHRATVDRIIEPDKAGFLRTTQVIIREEGTGEVIFSPPPAVEIPFLINDYFFWLNSEAAKNTHPVIRAAITHYVLVAIHPFVEGNGRTVRAFTILLMMKEGYDVKRFFALEEYFDQDLEAYYDAFSKVDKQTVDISQRDLTPWIEYFSKSMAVEFTKIKEKVRKLSMDSRLRLKIGEQVALSARQVKIVEYLTDNGHGVMKDLNDIIPMVSEDTVLRDLKDLQNKGIIEKEGSTKAARYVLRH